MLADAAEFREGTAANQQDVHEIPAVLAAKARFRFDKLHARSRFHDR